AGGWAGVPPAAGRGQDRRPARRRRAGPAPVRGERRPRRRRLVLGRLRQRPARRTPPSRGDARPPRDHAAAPAGRGPRPPGPCPPASRTSPTTLTTAGSLS